MNFFRMNPQYRDYWSSYDSWAASQIDDLVESDCYQFRIYHAPNNAAENITGPNGYFRYALEITPGSWIIGYMHNNSAGAGASPAMQITDAALNHAFFSKPIPTAFWDSQDTEISLFPAAYPVVPPGIFIVEFWQSLANTQLCQMSFAVLEPIRDEGETPVTV